jgi:hypothetical protein
LTDDNRAKAEALIRVHLDIHDGGYSTTALEKDIARALAEAHAEGERAGYAQGINDAHAYVEEAGRDGDWDRYYHDSPTALADDLWTLLPSPAPNPSASEAVKTSTPGRGKECYRMCPTCDGADDCACPSCHKPAAPSQATGEAGTWKQVYNFVYQRLECPCGATEPLDHHLLKTADGRQLFAIRVLAWQETHEKCSSPSTRISRSHE